MFISSSAFGVGFGFDKQMILDTSTLSPVSDIPLKDLLHDQVKAYDEGRERIRLKTVFRYGGSGIYGFYSKKDDIYTLVKFDL